MGGGRRVTAIPPGAWVTLSHALLPVSGEALVTDAQVEPASGRVTLSAVVAVGSVPAITVDGISTLFEGQETGLQVQQNGSLYTITATDRAGNPVPGARVTLGSATRTADSQGQVTFSVDPGSYPLRIVYPDGTEQTTTVSLGVN